MEEERGKKMFSQIQSLLNTFFTDMQKTFISLFMIGMAFCGIMVWFGDEHNVPKFKRGLMFCAIGLVVFLLAKPIVNYIKGAL